jgi:5'-nucleotidase
MFSLDDFDCADINQVQKKLQTIIRAGKEKLHVVADFDRTLTKSKNDLGESVTSWAMLEKHLPFSAQQDCLNLFKKYRPMEIAGKMTLQDAVFWWEEVIRIMIRNKIKWLDVARDVEKRMPRRAGTHELFDTCEKHKIPLIIISAGVRDVIELWCQKLDFKPDLILSTDLIFDEEGYLAGWKKETLVHALNKKEQGHKELMKIRQIRPNTILLGDSMDDAAMVETADNVLKIMVSEETDRERALTKFDLCVKGNSLLPVVNLLKLC